MEQVTEDLVRQNGNQAAAVITDYTPKRLKIVISVKLDDFDEAGEATINSTFGLTRELLQKYDITEIDALLRVDYTDEHDVGWTDMELSNLQKAHDGSSLSGSWISLPLSTESTSIDSWTQYSVSIDLDAGTTTIIHAEQ